MTFLSCLAIGVAFLMAVGLLVTAAILLGWYLPVMLERARRGGLPPTPRAEREPDEAGESGPGLVDPPQPGA